VATKKVILDVGTGTGALAMQAVKAGAYFVHAVEASDMAKEAKRACALVDQGHRIKVYHAKVEDLEELE
jgi:predicted RNA methylase